MIYLASPYTAHVPPEYALTADDYSAKKQEENYINACIACARIMMKGHLVYSPIAHWHVIDLLTKEFQIGEIGYEDYLAADCEMIDKCDELWVLMLDGWEKSNGVKYEIGYAEMKNKPIKYYILEEDGIYHDTSR
jgi:hypothetical protein